MRQRRSLFLTTATGMLAAVLAVTSAAAVEILKGPYLQNVQPERVTVMWETDEQAPGVVEYGPTAALGRYVWGPQARVHEVTLAGLAPRTAYHYRVRTGAAASPTATFTTAFHGEGAFSFAVYGDTRDFPARHAEVVKLMLSKSPDFVLHTGDLVGQGSDYDQWGEQFFGPAADLMRSRCLWPVLGNHDEDAAHYYAFFSLPAPERWYTFIWGNARFVGLDANRSLSARSEQVRWLERELRERKATWTFVFLHYPAYSGGLHGSATDLHDALVPLLERYRVDIVFGGHNHLYERSYPLARGRRDDARGVVYMTAAGGGAPLYPFQPQEWTAAGVSQLHACFVKVDGPNLHVEARDPADGLLDVFEITKDRARVDRLLGALTSPEPSAAIVELGLLGEVRAEARLAELVRGGALATRRAAAETLARLSTPGGAAALAAVARGPDAALRRFAVRGLARARQAEHLGAVAAALDDADPAVAAEAIDGLAWAGSEAAQRALARYLNRPETAPALRLKAVLALGQLATGRPIYRDFESLSDAEPVLVVLLTHPDLEVACAAAKALKEHDSATSRQALCAALDRPYLRGDQDHDAFDEDVLEALRRIADRWCGEALLRYVADESRQARNRERAAKALNRIAGVEVAFDGGWPAARVEEAVRRWREALQVGRPAAGIPR